MIMNIRSSNIDKASALEHHAVDMFGINLFVLTTIRQLVTQHYVTLDEIIVSSVQLNST